MRTAILLLCFLFSITNSFAQDCGDRYLENVFSAFKRTPNLVYGRNINSSGRNEPLSLDVYEPVDDDLPLRPVLVLMHGGAYWSGNKNMNEVAIPCRELAKRGFVTVSVGYRIEALFTSLLFEDLMIKAVGRGTQDAKAAVRYLYRDVIENGNRFRIDTNFIFVGGWSAGSLNALHMAYLDDINEMLPRYQELLNEIGGIEGTTGNAGFSSKVAGVININGALGSAEYMNNNTDVPLVSVHNTGDPQIPFYQGQPYGIPTLPVVDGSMKLHEKALELGMYNPFYIIDNDDHTSSDFFGIPVQPYLDSTLYYTSIFCRHVMGCEDVVSGVDGPLSQSDLNMFPNPSAGQLHITSNKLDQPVYHIRIIDNLGRNAAQTDWSPGTLLDTRQLGLSQGVYYVLVADNKGVSVGGEKIVIGR